MTTRIVLFMTLFAAVASARPAVQIVVDASSGAPLSTVLEQVKSATQDVRSVELSLRLAGGGAGDDACRATRTVVPAGVTPGPVIDALLPKVSASGPRPLAAAVEGAAADLPRRMGTPKGLVLITHGGDSCGRDTCDTMAEARRVLGLGQVFVLFTGKSRQEARRLECAGQMVRVAPKDVGARLRAFLDGFAQPAALRASIADGASGHIEIYAAGDEVPTAKGPSGSEFPLVAGRWNVRAVTSSKPPRDGWRRDVELAAGSTVSVRVALGGEPGKLVVDVRLNGRPAPGGTRLFVHRPGLVDEEVASGWPGEAFAVPPGLWDVRAVIPGGPAGAIEVWRPEVRVGDGQRLRFTLDSVQKLGFLQVDVKSGDVVIEDAGATLYPGDNRSGEGLSLIIGQAEPTPVGRYTVGVEWHSPGGSIRKWVSGVEVDFEKITKKVIDIGPTGMLTVDLQNQSKHSDARIAVVRPRELEPVDTVRPLVPYRLPAGRYNLRVVQKWPLPGVWWHRDVEVEAGEEKLVLIKIR